MVKSPTEADQPKTCFLICPIGAEGSPTRKRSDKLQKYVVERVLKGRGYKVERADKVGEPGIITNQIVRRIVDCDVLIADLSEHNPNVFYELAIRHGLKKPFVHIIDAAEPIPFDNAQVRAIQVDLTDLDSVESACRQLEDQVTAIESAGYEAESPISVAFDLESLKSSGKPDEAILATVLEEMSALRREVALLRVPRPASGIRFRPPTTSDELFKLLERNGEDQLADYLRNNMNIDSIQGYAIDMSVSRGGVYKDVEDELANVLRRATGKPWIIESLPF